MVGHIEDQDHAQSLCQVPDLVRLVNLAVVQQHNQRSGLAFLMQFSQELAEGLRVEGFGSSSEVDQALSC